MTRRWAGRRLVAVLLGAALAPWLQSGLASAAEGPAVRALDARADAALRAGLDGSATFRELVAAVRASDVVVYVETSQRLRTHGQTTFMSTAGGQRLLRVSLDFQNLGPWMIACLAHELQHAIEIAGAPDARDAEAVERLYRRIGEATNSGGWCTVAAKRAGADVLDDLLRQKIEDRDRR
jgi:hypothetical protein